MRPADVLVAVPAHNEAATVGACLRSVAIAIAAARSAGAIDRAQVAVGLHRCSDDTATRVRDVLADHPELPATVLVENARLWVGQVRTRIVDQAAQDAGADDDTWVFSTDADSVVPSDWFTTTLQQVARTQADLVLGLVELEGWEVDPAARGAYERIIGAGISSTGHSHVYAANLAVRLGTFRAVGGFPDVPSGEEHALAAAVRTAGFRVVSTASPRVRTSARMPGRAAHGLGALLADLAAGGVRRERAESAATEAAEPGDPLDPDAFPYPEVLP